MKATVVRVACISVAASCASCQDPPPKLAATRTGDVSNPAAVRYSPGQPYVEQCGAGALTAQGTQILARQPYVQQLTPTSALVLFAMRSDASRSTEVSHLEIDVTSPGGDVVATVTPQSDAADASGLQEVATLEDLEPDTAYCYSVAGLTQPVGFRTPPPAGAVGSGVRFAVFGDSGDGGRYQRAVRDQMATVHFDLLLHTGDLAYGSGRLAELESQYFGVYSEFLKSVPAYPALGNHDYKTGQAAPFRQVFALPENGAPEGLERWYSFDWGNVHFVALDTEELDSPQLQWLTHDLQNSKLPFTVAYMHRPAYSSGHHGSSLTVRRALSPIFEKYGVQVVFAGHDHDYERTRSMGGVTYIVTGGGGASTRFVGISSFTAFSEDVLHFVYGEVDAQEMLLHAIDGVGREFDSVRLPAKPSRD